MKLVYVLIVLNGNIATFPQGSEYTLPRSECLDHMMLIRNAHPSARVICRAENDSDIIDSARLLRPDWAVVDPIK